MKSSVATLAIAAAALATAAAQDEPKCLSGEIVKLAGVFKAGSAYQQCVATSAGFTLLPIIGAPTETQWKAMCVNPACSTAAADIRTVTTLGDCLVVNSLTLKSYNVFRFGRDYAQLCAPYTTAPTTAPPAPTPTSTTTAPAPVPATIAPTSTPTTVAPSPAPTTAAPTPAPTTSTLEPDLPKPSC